MSDLSPQEQYLLELINRARSDPGAEAARLGISLNQGLAPGTISNTEKQPLAGNDLLSRAAADHSAWMLATDTFSHTGAGGSSAGDRIEAAGYENWRIWGENLAYRGGGDVRTVEVIEGHHDGLFRSAGHRRNLMDNRFTEIGLGQEFGVFERFNASMLTEKFASDGGDPFLLGVVYDDLDGDDFFDPGEELSGVTVTVNGQGTTETSAGGGYELRVNDGETVSVTFSGGGLSAPVTRAITIGEENVKLDIRLDEIAGPAPQPPVSDPPAPDQPLPDAPTPGEPNPQPPNTPEQPNDPTPQPPAPGDSPTVHAGGPGDDRLIGGAEADRMAGRAGDDVLRGRGGDDQLRGHKGKDLVIGNRGDDSLWGGGGSDTLKGGAGDDRLVGGGGADRMVGGGGDDYLIAGRGADRLKGGGGADQFEFNARAGANVITDFQIGVDQIVLRGPSQDFADLDISTGRNGAEISIGKTDLRLLRVEAEDLSADDFVFL